MVECSSVGAGFVVSPLVSTPDCADVVTLPLLPEIFFVFVISVGLVVIFAPALLVSSVEVEEWSLLVDAVLGVDEAELLRDTVVLVLMLIADTPKIRPNNIT